jgi:DNA-binding IclR family transcriptional regulator
MRRRTTHSEELPRVDSLHRGLEILRAFRPGEFTLRSKEIATKLSLPPATVQSLLDTLVAADFLRYLPAVDAYEPGASCITVGQALRFSMPVLQVAQPILQALATKYDLTVTLATRERLQMLRLVHCTGESAGIFGVGAGALLPIASTAMGRAYLWALPSREQAKLIEQIRMQGGESSISAVSGIYGAFQELEERGYCFAITELVKNACAVAAPLILDERAPVLALGAMVSGVKQGELLLQKNVGPELLAAAEQIKSGLAHA